MCWHSANLNIKIAEKDVTCYKYLLRSKDSNGNIILLSSIMNFQYKLNINYPTIDLSPTLTKNCLATDYKISKEYHSLVDYKTAIRGINSTRAFFLLAKCYIPKGSKYAYSGEQDTYVSSSIRIDSIIPIYDVVDKRSFDDIHKAKEFYLHLIQNIDEITTFYRTKYVSVVKSISQRIMIIRHEL